MSKMRSCDFAGRLLGKWFFRQYLMARRDRFLHHLPPGDRQRPDAAARQIPQASILVPDVKKNHALACVRMVKSAAGIFLDQLKELLPPRPTGVIEDFFAKLLEFFNTDYSNRFGDGFAALTADGFGVGEFFEWHRTRLFGWIPAESVPDDYIRVSGIGQRRTRQTAS